eukprot:12919436-Prorocentrum_lima.AAC.1
MATTKLANGRAGGTFRGAPGGNPPGRLIAISVYCMCRQHARRTPVHSPELLFPCPDAQASA